MAQPIIASEFLSSADSVPPEQFTPVLDRVSEYDKNRAGAAFADTMQAIGALTCLATRIFVDAGGHTHITHNAVMQLSSGRFCLKLTEPALDYDGPDTGNFAMMHGFTEDAAYGTARNLHRAVSAEFPGKQIVSVSTDGYQKAGGRLPLRDVLSRDFEAMAGSRLELMREIADDEPVTIFGLSMGTIIAKNMIKLNIDNQQINHDVSVFHSPAIVPPQRVLKDMVLKFPPHISGDTLREAIHHPWDTLHSVHMPPGPGLVPAYLNDMVHLMLGTPESEVNAILDETRLGVIKGSRDPLGQHDLWTRLQLRHPDTLRVVTKPGLGHGSSVNAAEAAWDIRQMAVELEALPAIS